MTSIAALRELHATIGAALDDIDRVYTAQGLAYPHLDTPSNSDRDAAAEKLTHDPTVSVASSSAIAACNRLIAELHNPYFALLQGLHLGHVTAALSFLEASNTVEILREAGHDGLHARDLARKITEVRLASSADTDVEPLDAIKLSHVLRLLATYHWVREVKPDVWANNRLTMVLDTGKTTEQLKAALEKKYDDTNAAAAMTAMCTSELFRSVTALTEWLLPSKDKPKNPPTPFHVAYNTALDYYSWLERPENSSKLAVVGRAMGFGRHSEGRLTMADKAVFAWDALPQNAAVVDVGGGIGSVAVQVAEAHPHLRIIVQDRPQTIAMAPHAWGTKHKELFDSGRVSFQPQDFFEPQPTTLQVPGVGEVAHTAVYIVTRVMHNWPDAECVKILSNLRAAAGPDTKLILHEVILPLACPERESDSDSLASGIKDDSADAYANIRPPLLLPYSSSCDLTMMALMNSRERTLRELSDLALSAGWRIVSVARSDSPLRWGYMTAVPV
ncbi:S-adenosyl-L-methionine-dependent methyltransferase [Trametes cingulata]|nr:S-adenosyl-L-methionine-dependent methyltransferase [Trametes cingulata]